MNSNPGEQSHFETGTTPGNLGEDPSTPEASTNASRGRFQFDAMNLKVGDRLQAQTRTKVAGERPFCASDRLLAGSQLADHNTDNVQRCTPAVGAGRPACHAVFFQPKRFRLCR